MEFKDFPQEIHPERLYVIDNIERAEVILDLGCGNHKTIDKAIGVDIRPVTDVTSSIDCLSMKADTADLIISRHSFEHMLDPVKTLREWWRVLKPGGRIIFVLPDQEFINTVHPFYSNNEHMHAYTRKSLENLVTLFGFIVSSSETVILNWSFGLIVRK